VVGVGQVSCDFVVALPRWPRAGEKTEIAERPATRPGGQIATAVLAAVRLGLSGRFICAVGDDREGEVALEPLRAAGVDLARVNRMAGGATRSAFVLVDEHGERTVLAHRDPRVAIAPAHLSRSAIGDARVLLVDGEDPDAAEWAIEVAREAGIASVLDVESADPDRVKLAMSVDFPIVSETFCSDSSKPASDAAVREWLARLAGARARMAVVTRGERGAVAICDGVIFAQPAIAVSAVDTTGAGDVFRGAFAWALLRGASARRAVALAATAGALACRGAGAQGALPGADEVEQGAG
jgi:sulfofructose kinase